jgi:hypothetical protein
MLMGACRSKLELHQDKAPLLEVCWGYKSAGGLTCIVSTVSQYSVAPHEHVFAHTQQPDKI